MKKDLKNIKNIKKIAIIRTDRIGEVLLATPLVKALKSNFPNADISFVTSLYAKPIISGNEDLSKVIIFDTDIKRSVFLSAIALAGRLRKSSFDMAIILNPHKALHLATFFSGIRCRVGYDRKWPFLLTHKVKDEKAECRMHEVEYNLDLLKAIGISEKPVAPYISPDPKSSIYISSLFEKLGIVKNKRVVAIHPGSSNPSKRWPTESFRSLARTLSDNKDVALLLIGDKSEISLCNSVSKDSGDRIYNIAGQIGIKELTALLERIDLLITNDNGPMHIAAAVGTKVVAIFQSAAVGSNPTRWGPYGEGHLVLQDPSVEDLIESVKRILK